MSALVGGSQLGWPAFCPWSLQPSLVSALGGVPLPLPLEEAGVLAFPLSPAPSPLSLPSSQPLQSLTFTSMSSGIQVGPGLSAWGGGGVTPGTPV